MLGAQTNEAEVDSGGRVEEMTVGETRVPGRPLIRGHFFQNSPASISYRQIAQYFDM